MSVEDCLKEVSFCKKANIPVLGVLENMSGFVCPVCSVRILVENLHLITHFSLHLSENNTKKKLTFQESTNIFSSGGGQSLASITSVPFLGSLPIDPSLGECGEKGKSCIATNPNSPAAKVFKDLVGTIAEKSKMPITPPN